MTLRRYQFGTLHLLLLAACVAILLTALRISSAIAITLLVSVIPALGIALWLKQPSWGRTRFALSFAIFTFALFFIYALSLGPALKLTLAMGWSVNLEIPYSPIIWLDRHTMLNGPIESYLKLWT